MNELRAAWRALRARVEELAERRQHYLDLFEHAESGAAGLCWLIRPG